MYYKVKDGLLWVWSSKRASLDCMPQYKFKTLEQMNKALGIAYEKSIKNDRLYSWAANLNEA